MARPVVKGAAYVLVHAPEMVMHYGTTCSSEREVNPNSEFLKKVPNSLRTFEETVKYAPNQAYIGNILPDELNNIPRPWYKNLMEDAKADGKIGEIVPQDELYGVMKICDAFDLVMLEKEFSDSVKEKLAKKAYFQNKN